MLAFIAHHRNLVAGSGQYTPFAYKLDTMDDMKALEPVQSPFSRDGREYFAALTTSDTLFASHEEQDSE